MDITKYRRLAWKELQTVENHRNYDHVSIILKKNKFMSIGTNRRKTHPAAMIKGYRHNELHSELDALLRICHTQRNNLTLLNFRFGPKGDLKISKPCKLCLPWCTDAFVEIFYSVPDGLVQMDY